MSEKAQLSLRAGIRLVVGLGNPGTKYRHTPHNVGFLVTDILADRHGGQWRESRRFRAEVATVEVAGRLILLVQPRTYMNLSGEAVAPFARYRAILPEQMLVVCDDIDLPMGKVRLRQRGSAGSHKGLVSIVEALGTREFARLRIGIHPGEAVEDLTEYVLTPWWGDARKAMESVCAGAADAVERAIAEGLGAAMSQFNGRDFLEPAPDTSP